MLQSSNFRHRICQLKPLSSFYTRTRDSVSPNFLLAKLKDRQTNEMPPFLDVNQVSANQMVVLTNRCLDCLFRLRSRYLAVRTRKMENTMAWGKSQCSSRLLPDTAIRVHLEDTGKFWMNQVPCLFGSEMLGSLWRSCLTLRQRLQLLVTYPSPRSQAGTSM